MVDSRLADLIGIGMIREGGIALRFGGFMRRINSG
jgi:hypothetical protein